MSAEARRNGWRGFDGLAEKVDGGWEYRCDGMPSMFGCGSTLTVTRRWSKVGTKKSGWLVCYGQEPKPGARGHFDNPDEWEDDHDVVLTFCPLCADVVKQQAARHAKADQ